MVSLFRKTRYAPRAAAAPSLQARAKPSLVARVSTRMRSPYPARSSPVRSVEASSTTTISYATGPEPLPATSRASGKGSRCATRALRHWRVSEARLCTGMMIEHRGAGRSGCGGESVPGSTTASAPAEGQDRARAAIEPTGRAIEDAVESRLQLRGVAILLGDVAILHRDDLPQMGLQRHDLLVPTHELVVGVEEMGAQLVLLAGQERAPGLEGVDVRLLLLDGLAQLAQAALDRGEALRRQRMGGEDE